MKGVSAVKKFFTVALIFAMMIVSGCDSEKSAKQPKPVEAKAEQRVVKPEKVLNLGMTIQEFKSAFDRIAVERNVPQFVLNDIRFFDSGEKFVQQYPAGLYLFGVIDRKTGLLKEVTITKEFVLSKNKRQSEVDVASIAFLVALAALNPALSSNERAEILNKLSKNAENSSVMIGNADYSSLLFDKGKSLSLSIKAKDSEE